MATIIDGVFKVTRRAAGGAAGAPSSALSGQIFYNEVDDTLYIGFGDDGSGNATSIRAFAGAGTFVSKAFLDDALENTGAGDMLKSTYDANNDGIVDRASIADSVDWEDVSGKPGNATTSTSGLMSSGDKTKLDGVAANANNYSHPTGDGNQHVPATGTGNNGKVLKAGATAGSASWQTLAKSDVGLGAVDNTSDAAKPISTAQQAALDLKAPLASPALTGTPTAPTAAGGNNTTQIATTAFVQAAVAALIDGAPGAIDTLNELASALGDDPNFASTVTTALAGKLAASANLSDVANAATAWSNLGGGSLGKQAADNVNITGGTISNVVFDGGTF